MTLFSFLIFKILSRSDDALKTARDINKKGNTYNLMDYKKYRTGQVEGHTRERVCA